jgi:Na+/H+-dicarboxylate symporter
MAGNATKIFLTIIVGVCISNFISTMLSHYVGAFIYNFNMSIILPHSNDSLPPAWAISFPKLIPNSLAMLAGLLLGCFSAMYNKPFALSMLNKIDRVVDFILNMITYLIPIFVLGFVIKLQFDNSMGIILKNYSSIFIVVALAQIGYICFLYLIVNSCNIKSAVLALKNMLPAALLGFSSMSSATAMPLTILGIKNNTTNKEIASSVIPITTNIHLIGDCFAIPIFAYAILKNYGITEPSMLYYLIFAFHFVIAKFSVAAIPGGGIIVMIPILEKYLGFNSDMSSLITALYILFDPIITGINVLGNGAFAKVIDKLIRLTPANFLRKASNQKQRG